MIVAAVAGVLSFEMGLYLSYELSVPPGAAIVLIQFAMLLLAVAGKRLSARA
jgi:ABC-type Mn2+/Zn2+ transport system permease subunit